MHLIKVCDTKNMPVEEWLKRRKNGIGGSDAGVLLGFNRYKGQFNVYVDKVTEHTEDLSENEKVYWGNVFEPIVAKEFARRTGKKVERVNAILRHPKYEYIIANIDRRVVGENAILECKTTGAFNEAEWKDEEIPESYICQCQHYMAVTGAEKCYIACLIAALYGRYRRGEMLYSLPYRRTEADNQNHIKRRRVYRISFGRGNKVLERVRTCGKAAGHRRERGRFEVFIKQV